jgi:DNA-binding GntR family transcriptional regulator
MKPKGSITIDDIGSQLRGQIIGRSISPGTKLSESLLSSRWNVSRTPMREVLRRLEAEGLVTSSRYKGFVVNTITIDDVNQIYTINMLLGGLAGRLATPTISEDPKKLTFMEKLCKEMGALSKKGDVRTYLDKNREFHFYFLHCCGNKWLIKIIENLTSQVDRFIVKALQIPHRMEKSVQEHWKIYEMFKKKDGRMVEKVITNHFKNSLEDIKKELIKET